jgi:fermentation-respiration switch protein FrsA (DUF1100 family)
MRKVAAFTTLPPWTPALAGMTTLGSIFSAELRQKPLKRQKTRLDKALFSGAERVSNGVERRPKDTRTGGERPVAAVVDRVPRSRGDRALSEARARRAPASAVSIALLERSDPHSLEDRPRHVSSGSAP